MGAGIEGGLVEGDPHKTSPGCRQLYVAFNVDLKESGTVLVLAPFYPVSVDLKSTTVDRLA